MKKRLSSALLFGALFVASSSVFVSCKDYDDDINNLQAQIDKKADQTALEQAKTDLKAEIANLKTQLEAKDAELATLITQLQAKDAELLALINTKADQSALDATNADLANTKTDLANTKSDLANTKADLEAAKTNLQNEIARALAAESALETRIAKAEEAITSINGLIAKLQEEKVDKTTYEKEVAAIYGKIETVQTGLANSIKQLTDNLAEEVKARAAAIENLQAQITALQAFQKKVESEYATKVDLQNEINKLQQALGKQITDAQTELQNKIDKAQSDLEKSIDTTNKNLDQAKSDLKKEIGEVQDALEKKIKDLSDNVYTKAQIDAKMVEVGNMISKINGEINVLTLVAKDLRSLMFIPDAYYHGIEATKLFFMSFYKYQNVPAAAADKEEERGYNEPDTYLTGNDVARTVHKWVAGTKYGRYDSIADFKVLDFAAHYHMNPSTAKIADFKKVKILDMDREYINTRSSEALITAVDNGWSASNGDLKVNLVVNDPAKIKSVFANKQVTVFATEVTVGRTNAADTTITSDYAALYADNISGLRISHKDLDGVTAAKNTETGLENVHCGTCDLDGKPRTHLHLFATVAEARKWITETARVKDGKLGEGMDTLLYDAAEGRDLAELVETHYTTVDGKHQIFDNDQNFKDNFYYKFELTELILGTNVTSESAHASMNGSKIRATKPTTDGKSAGWEAGVIDRVTIDRVPLVRVSLILKEDRNGNKDIVVDYGYLPIRIAEKKVAPSPKSDIVVGPYTATDDWWLKKYDSCTEDMKDKNSAQPVYGYTTNWVQTEYDLISRDDVEMTREEFEANYWNVKDVIAGTEFNQYAVVRDASGNITGFTKITDPTKLVGSVNYKEDQDLLGTKTSVLKWELTACEARQWFYVNGYNSSNIATKPRLEIAIRLQSANAKYKDIYVIFAADLSKIKVTEYVAGVDKDIFGTVDFKSKQTSNYWFTTNTGTNGKDEIHAQTLSPEDQHEAQSIHLDETFADAFVGNVITNGFITTTAPDDYSKGVYAANKMTIDLIFAPENVNKEFKGYLGYTEKVFVMSVTDNGKTLQAHRKDDVTAAKQTVAIITGTTPNNEKVEYQHSAYAHALLNYRASNALNNDVLIVKIAMTAETTNPVQHDVCTGATAKCQLPLKDNTFDVRFLRPINVESADKSIYDAGAQGLQELNMRELVKLTDWRLWNATFDCPSWKDADAFAAYNYSTPMDYWFYYGIKAVKVYGADDALQGQKIANLVYTNLNQANTKENCNKILQDVNDNLELKYYPAVKTQATAAFGAADSYGKIVYKNLSSTVTDFMIKIPVSVEYIWGEITTYVYVNVSSTPVTSRR